MLRAATPYLVSWDDVSVQVLQANISAPSIPKLLNMSLVGLGQLKDDQESLSKDSNLPLNNSEPTNSLLNSSANLLTPGSAIDKQMETENTNAKELKSITVDKCTSTAASASCSINEKMNNSDDEQLKVLKPSRLVSQTGY